MPLDPYLVSRLHLLEGLEVSPESLKDEALWERVREFNVDPSPWSMPDLTLTELGVPGPHGPVPVRIYETKNRDPIGCLLWVHGGGFTSGSVDSNEAHVVSAELAARAGAKVVSVDYRLASETVQYPVPLDDVFAAWGWLVSQAAGRPEGKMLALGGASAGAALALAAAVRSKDGDERKPDMLLLAYPFVHFPVPALERSIAQEMAPLPDLLRFTPAAIEGMVRAYVWPDRQRSPTCPARPCTAGRAARNPPDASRIRRSSSVSGAAGTTTR